MRNTREWIRREKEEGKSVRYVSPSAACMSDSRKDEKTELGYVLEIAGFGLLAGQVERFQ